MHQAYPKLEVLVYDDASADDTAARVVALATDRRVRLVRGGPLPPGWRGKPHACHRLRGVARGEVLVFADADVTALPGAAAGIAAAFSALPVDAFSLVPAHGGSGRMLRALVAVQQWAALTFVPSWLPLARRSALFAATNGQCIAIRAAVYDAVGGFAAVRTSLAEDVALGRRLVEQGYRLRMFDAPRILRCTPYATIAEWWRASLRNLTPVFFGVPELLVGVAAALVALYVAPPALLAVGLARSRAALTWIWLPLIEIALGAAPRALADRRFGHSLSTTLLHVPAIVMLVVAAITAAVRARLGWSVEWRGRRYAVSDEAA